MSETPWVDEFRHPTPAEIAAARAAAPRGVWLITGTLVESPYSCRCGERRGRVCSPAWCPCAGRTDPPAGCCGHRFTAEDHLVALREWQAQRDAAARGETP